MPRQNRMGLQVDTNFADFIEQQVLEGLPVSADQFWQGLSEIVHDLGPKNRELIQTRETLQTKIDNWHIDNRSEPYDPAAYKSFLHEIGYLVETGAEFTIDTANVDDEIAHIPGPQLVVPITNARYALNAANARWGSLYDALYGTDALGDLPKGGPFDPDRGARVVAWAKEFLDENVPLQSGSFSDVTGFSVVSEKLVMSIGATATHLANEACFVGYLGSPQNPTSIILQNNHLRLQIIIDPENTIGADDPANIADVRLESAISSIMDCEDSVAVVDAPDKILAYGNWLGLMKGDLSESVVKNGKTRIRTLSPDLEYCAPDGQARTLKGRALMLVRNVGHLMTNPTILDRNGLEIGEGLLDAMCTTAIAMHDLAKTGRLRNSLTGSVYVVKPKMHGPQEVAFADEVFSRVEAALGIAQNTVKLGIMDEERRTSVNLGECIRAAKSRVVFINTGFLDRTGDEIHTSMEAGVFLRKQDIKSELWISAYEDHNVDVGLACGLRGRAQIGKGMWAAPDLMHDMLAQKQGHPNAGANCAWVPSPTAATLHATHYHRADVLARQQQIAAAGTRASVEDILQIPLARGQNWSQQEITSELENNAQGILGYVVRWIDHGVGCSKVPDIHDVGLMEDRATCRISSQHMANWLHHGVTDAAAVIDVMKRMAITVDAQNADDPAYQPMAPTYDGFAFQAACDLVLKGRIQPSGYTEPLLHAYRLKLKGL